MEAAASIVGLLTVGAKIYLSLHEFISGCVDAPAAAEIIRDEVTDFGYALSKLQPYIDGSTEIGLLGAQMTDVNQLSITLGASVVTFSRLEKTLDRLVPRYGGRRDALNRLRWSWAEKNISQLVQRVQQHKLSLTLLTIWISESFTEAQRCTGVLNDQLAAMLPQLTPLGHTRSGPPTPASEYPSTAPLIPRVATAASRKDTDSDSVFTMSNRSLSSYRRVFEPTLLTSRPYRNIRNGSTISLASSQRGGTRWSLFSGGSNTSVLSLAISTFQVSGHTLAETSDLSSIPLPLLRDALYSPWWYSTGRITAPMSSTSFVEGSLTSISLTSGNTLGSILVHAAGVGDTWVVLRMLEFGICIESTDERNRTPLLQAADGNHTATIRALLDHGASINVRNNDGSTPLHLAARNGDDMAVRMLLDKGAEAGAKDNSGDTPLQVAISNSHLAVTVVFYSRVDPEFLQ